MFRRLPCVCALAFVTGCNVIDANAPDRNRFINLAVTGGADQVGAPGTMLNEPITVRLLDLVVDQPVRNRPVRFRVASGSGIEIEPVAAQTDHAGLVSVLVRLGPEFGRYAIDIDFAGNPSDPGKVFVEAAREPVIMSVTPSGARADEEISIFGRHFGERPQSNDVRIDNIHAEVTHATSTALRVRVPRCLPSGTTQVQVRRGSLQSGTAPLDVTGSEVELIDLQPTEPLAPTKNLGCMRLAGHLQSAQYLVVPLNVAQEGEPAATFQLTGSSGSPSASAQRTVSTSARGRDPRVEFESRLRRLEADLLQRVQPRRRGFERPLLRTTPPQLGDRRVFNVLNPWYGFGKVTGVIQGIGSNVIIYVDQQTSDVTEADVDSLVRVFDDPIFTTATSVYGNTSDIDLNGKVAVLLTPAVNRLTPAGSNGYIAGYFYGCDLLDVLECPDGNSGEVLYTMVPDPSGQSGLQHTRENVLRILPSVVAHELAHLIHFNERILEGGTPTAEALWMAEALAHAAEDTVAGVLRHRGDTAAARGMTRENYKRASFYLTAPHRTSLVAVAGGGTLEERGAGWLLLKYLQSRFGGAVLGRLTAARGIGSQNVASVTGVAWSVLMRDWATALYAAGAPELNGSIPDPAHTFGSFDLRAAISSVSDGKYPLLPTLVQSNRFTVDVSLAASSASYLLVTTAPGESLSLNFAGSGGQPFRAGDRPEIAILRLH